MTGYASLASQEAIYWHGRADELRRQREILVSKLADDRTLYLIDKAIEAAEGVAKWYAVKGEAWMRASVKL